MPPDDHNINDPADIQALLDQLKSSDLWKNIVTPSISPDVSVEPLGANAPSMPSVSDLLAQLQRVPEHHPSHVRSDTLISDRHRHDENATTKHTEVTQRTVLALKPDNKNLSYQKSLPILAQLADNPQFIHAVTEMKKRQHDLEKSLLKERNEISSKYQEKVSALKTKANIIGTGISQHDATMLSDTYKKELHRFDLQRVLPAWDGLIVKQQEELESLSVPTMWVTSSSADTERQIRVIRALEGIFADGSE